MASLTDDEFIAMFVGAALIGIFGMMLLRTTEVHNNWADGLQKNQETAQEAIFQNIRTLQAYSEEQTSQRNNNREQFETVHRMLDELAERPQNMVLAYCYGVVPTNSTEFNTTCNR